MFYKTWGEFDVKSCKWAFDKDQGEGGTTVGDQLRMKIKDEKVAEDNEKPDSSMSMEGIIANKKLGVFLIFI